MRSGVTWKIEFESAAAREFRKLEPEIKLRIRDFFQNRVVSNGNPRAFGKPLRGKRGLWRYRIGTHRVIAQFLDSRLVILVVRIGHRREVYRK